MQSKGLTLPLQNRMYQAPHQPQHYPSPKVNPVRHRDQWFSPSVQQKYPSSQKYNHSRLAPRFMQSSDMSSFTEVDSNVVESADLRLTITQLRNSLHLANQNVQRLQEQVMDERRHTFELSECKRRLQEEFGKMEFELERIGNYQSLEERQSSVRLEAALRDNMRSTQQVNDLLDQNKGLKQEQRKLMSEADRLVREKEFLLSQNEELLSKLRLLERDVKDVRKELQSQSQLLQGPTNRSQHVATVNGSITSLPLEPLQQVDYQRESEKLLGDYQKLLVENQSMKRLYNEFHKGTDPNPSIFKQNQPKVDRQKREHQVAEFGSFSNQHILEKLSSNNSVSEQQEASPMFRTTQKAELKSQLQSLRQQTLSDIQHSYRQVIVQAEKEKKNALKLFIQQLSKGAQAFGKMAQNYLQMRAVVREEAGVESPLPIRNIQGGEGAVVLQLYQSVKEKAKGEGSSGLGVAIFRLLTLMARCQSTPAVILENMQHSILKYVFKFANPTPAT